MDTSTMATLFAGFALGLKHATDADHIVAVSTLVSDAAGEGGGPRRSIAVGAWWGLGHLLSVFAAGGALVALRVKMSAPVEWALEVLVALVLIWVGVNTFRRCLTGRYHFHVHRHGERLHAHLHYHAGGAAVHEHESHAGQASRTLRQGRKPLLVGMAHGLAGTAALALLVLSSISSQTVGLVYLLVFGVGAMVGMAAFSAVLSWPLHRRGPVPPAAAEKTLRLTSLDLLRLAAGAASGIFGAVLGYRALLPQSWPF